MNGVNTHFDFSNTKLRLVQPDVGVNIIALNLLSTIYADNSITTAQSDFAAGVSAL